MIKNIFLDLDDTILDFQKGERKALHKAFSDMGVPTDEGTVKRYIEINLDCWRALERGQMTKDEVLVGRFEMLFREIGITASATEAQDIYEAYLAGEHDFLPGGEELLRAIEKSGKYRLFMATNGIPSVQKPRIKDSGVGRYFERIFISEEIGYAKPMKEFFDACFSEIKGFECDETIIVGDSLSSDIKGGINAGIRTCHFNPQGKPYGEITPDYTIRSLDELLPLLDSIE